LPWVVTFRLRAPVGVGALTKSAKARILYMDSLGILRAQRDHSWSPTVQSASRRLNNGSHEVDGSQAPIAKKHLCRPRPAARAPDRALPLWPFFCPISVSAPTTPILALGWIPSGSQCDRRKAQRIQSLTSATPAPEHHEMALETPPKPAKKCQKVPLFGDTFSSLDDRARR
jgi:hypothetical protein